MGRVHPDQPLQFASELIDGDPGLGPGLRLGVSGYTFIGVDTDDEISATAGLGDGSWRDA
jgi:hypothetical protein